MNNLRIRMRRTPMRAVALAVSLAVSASVADAAATPKAKSADNASSVPCSKGIYRESTQVQVGKATLYKSCPANPIDRMILGNPDGLAGQPRASDLVGSKSQQAQAMEDPKTTSRAGGSGALTSGGAGHADVILLSKREIYILGKSVGSTNIVMQHPGGTCTMLDITVGIDITTLETLLNPEHSKEQESRNEPSEKQESCNKPSEKQESRNDPSEKRCAKLNYICVKAAAPDAVVLSGRVRDALKVDSALSTAKSYVGSSAKVINMLSVDDPQQVMLEVKVAEVSKTLVDKLGAKFNMPKINGSWTYSVLSNFLNDSPGVLKAASGSKVIELDAEKKDGLIKILAEPTIMAISGQEGSFLAGGRILIPVAQSTQTGVTTITLEEKEFGVALKFTPTVLANGRINLKVRPEVSELSPEGIGISEYGTTSRSILPLINTRKAETTVQLNDGQSFAIGGLVKNNVTQNIKAFPLLGEIPFIGALFRSSDFQTDKSELVFVVTPRLVKPLSPDYALPTDSFVPPSRSEFFLEGKMEGASAGASPAASSGGGAPAAGGFELK